VIGQMGAPRRESRRGPTDDGGGGVRRVGGCVCCGRPILHKGRSHFACECLVVHVATVAQGVA
jgi:hypothetical protein